MKMLPEKSVMLLLLFNMELLSAAGAELRENNRDGKLFRFVVSISSVTLCNHSSFQHFFFDTVS
jgi:hypothetical protein